MTLVSLDHLACLAWMVDLVVMDSLEYLDLKELLALCLLKESVGLLVSKVLGVSQVTGVPQVPQALDLRDLQERKVSKVSQEDLELLVHLVLKVNLA